MTGGFTPEAFIGRTNELQRLEAILDRAGQGRPQVVLVAGDAGVGKTRLLLEFADRAQRRGVRVLAGGCVELGDIGFVYLPVVDALRSVAEDPAAAELLAEVAATAPGIRRLLPGGQRLVRRVRSPATAWINDRCLTPCAPCSSAAPSGLRWC